MMRRNRQPSHGVYYPIPFQRKAAMSDPKTGCTSTTPLSSYDVSRMTPERVKRVRQRGQMQRTSASMSQRRTSGSEGRFFWHPQPCQEAEGQEA